MAEHRIELFVQPLQASPDRIELVRLASLLAGIVDVWAGLHRDSRVATLRLDDEVDTSRRAYHTTGGDLRYGLEESVSEDSFIGRV